MLPLVRTLSKINQVQNISSYSFMITFNIILSLAPESSEWFFPSGIQTKTWAHFSSLMRATRFTHPF
jgi:hypothetical protein